MRLKTPVIGLVSANAMGLTMIGPVMADNTVTTTIGGGTLSAYVADASLTGAIASYSQSSQATGMMSLKIDDSSATGDGWNVTISSSAFTSGTTSTDIAATGFDISVGTPVLVLGQPRDAGLGNGPNAVSGGSLDEAVEVVDAGEAFGSGAYTQALPATLNVPAGTQAGAYVATLTVTASSGPGL